MKIALQVQTKHFIKVLGKSANGLQIVAAETLNEAAGQIDKNYKRNLKRHPTKIRNKFSLNSVKTFKATPIARTGTPRPLGKINAVVGVRKMKGGKEHYLAKAEEGGTSRGNTKTRNRVPIPLKSSRIGGSDNRAIARANRITTKNTQTLRIKGRPFGD